MRHHVSQPVLCNAYTAHVFQTHAKGTLPQPCYHQRAWWVIFYIEWQFFIGYKSVCVFCIAKGLWMQGRKYKLYNYRWGPPPQIFFTFKNEILICFHATS